MFSAALSIILLYLVFALMGVGYALFFIKNKRNFALVFTLSPIFGLGLTTLCGTYLILLNVKVATWAWPFTIVSILSSLLLASTVSGKSFERSARNDTIF